MKGRLTVNESRPAQTAEELETVDAMRFRVPALEAEREAMRAFAPRIAEARIDRDMLTMTESCPYCSLQRPGEYGYSGAHDEHCVVDPAPRLGF